MQLNPEHKEVKEFSSDYFDFGIHKVRILSFQQGETDDGKAYIESFFTDETGQIEDSARMWLTSDNAVNYTFNTLRSILVHNAVEEDKDSARDAFDALDSTEDWLDMLNDRLVGGEMWFTKYQDPQRTYTNQKTGEIKHSVNRNIYGYEPKPRPELLFQSGNEQASAPAAAASHSKDVSPDEIPF